MREELRFGKYKQLSFVLLDVICLFLANILAVWLYLSRSPEAGYGYDEQRPVMLLMLIIDILVTFFFNTLCRALRRNNRKELIEGAKHIGISFVILAVILFTLRQGARFSRISVYLSYGIYYVLFVLSHIAWKWLLQRFRKKGQRETAVLLTTDRFAEEGMEELHQKNFDIKYVYLMKNLNKSEIKGVPVLKRWEEVSASICWDMLDKVYVYALDHQMVPRYLIDACAEMGISFSLVDFTYRLIDITTIQNPDPRYGSLSFVEGRRDIPFPIKRVFWITETEANLHRGYHAHKHNCQLLFCPHGVIDIILDDGEKKQTVTLDKPGKGLLLMPDMWHEMIWRESGSVLCVLASLYYDAQEYLRDYDEYIEYNQKFRAAADPLKDVL